MSFNNSSGFVDLLSSAGASSAAAIELALPVMEIMFKGMSVTLVTASLLGMLLSYISMPTGSTDIKTLRNHFSIILCTWILLAPAMTIDATQINPLGEVNKKYDVGVGVFVVSKGIIFTLDTASRIAVSIAKNEDSRESFIAANSLVFQELASSEAMKGLSQFYTADTIKSRTSYQQICNKLLDKAILTSPSQSDTSISSSSNDFKLIKSQTWNALGLLGGQTLGYVEDPAEGIYPSYQEPEEESGLIDDMKSFLGFSSNEDSSEPDLSQAQTALQLLKDLDLNGGMFSTSGFRIDIPPTNDNPSQRAMTVSELNGYLSSLIESKAYVTGINETDAWFATSDENGASYEEFNAINCYQMYLIANKSMYLANKAATENFIRFSPTLSKFSATFNSNTEKFEGIQDIIEKAESRSFLSLSAMANEAIYAGYAKSESNVDPDAEGIINDLKNAGSHAWDFVKTSVNTTVSTTFETPGLIYSSFESDLTLPTVYGGSLLLLTFVLAITPIIASAALLFPGKYDAAFAWVKILAFITLFVGIITIGYAFYEVISEAAFNALSQNMAFYQTAPSAQLASTAKALQYGGFAIISISGVVSYLVVFGRPPMMKIGSTNSPNINLPKNFNPLKQSKEEKSQIAKQRNDKIKHDGGDGWDGPDPDDNISSNNNRSKGFNETLPQIGAPGTQAIIPNVVAVDQAVTTNSVNMDVAGDLGPSYEEDNLSPPEYHNDQASHSGNSEEPSEDQSLTKPAPVIIEGDSENNSNSYEMPTAFASESQPSETDYGLPEAFNNNSATVESAATTSGQQGYTLPDAFSGNTDQSVPASSTIQEMGGIENNYNETQYELPSAFKNQISSLDKPSAWDDVT